MSRHMGIQIKNRVFHLQTKDTSYIMLVNDMGYLCHVYYGARVNDFNLGANVVKVDTNLDTIPQECAAYGTGDFRVPTYEACTENGSLTGELKYVSYELMEGKPSITGLPASYCEVSDGVETLEILCKDAATGLLATLVYSVYPSYNIITRSIRYTNTGEKNTTLVLSRALSMSMDFDHDDFDLLQLSGSWSREKYAYRRAVVPGIQAIDSKRGISSAGQNPFLALLSKDANEDAGEVYAFNLVYSGNFLGEVEVDPYNHTRVVLGINPFQFGWELHSNETFETPEVVLTYSKDGLGTMTRTYHKFYRERMCRGTYQYEERPVLINNWEATYFNFNEDKIYEIAMTGKELGMELFVLDDGWFGHRDSDNSSLGDWFVDHKKLPNGLTSLVESITKEGIGFGLWFEPEMISPDSDLYTAHPDWCIHVPERAPMAGPHQRNQLVLDLSREDVCQYIIQVVSDILASAPISYVKWDMNRPITDIGSACLPKERQRELSHRYVLGLYRVLEEITSRFPNILFESCSSGGGRFDPGMLFYMPQTWTSDDTDAVERLKIQYGTSLVYPASTMGAHISACPNHQVGRYVGLEMRGAVAMCGNFGYELDLTKFSEEEKEIVREQVRHYKEIRRTVQFGDFYRLISPYDKDGNETAWGFVTEDKKKAVFFYYRVLARPNVKVPRLKFKGLSGEKKYTIQVIGDGNLYKEQVVAYGDELMSIGLERESVFGDFKAWEYLIEEID